MNDDHPKMECQTLPSSPSPLVVILAGGRSRRFGRDKAREPVLGIPSIERVFAAAAAAVGPDNVVVNASPTEGPLGAIVDSFACWPGRDLVILACDLPFIHSSAVARLAMPCNCDARMVMLDGRAQPLAAQYRADAAATFGAAFARGERSIVKVLDQSRLRIAWLADLSGDVVGDFDTPEDLRRLVATHVDVGVVAASESDER